MSELLPDDLVSEPLDAAQARQKCEAAATMMVERHVFGGRWAWIDDRRLRVYRANGDAFLTLYIESLQ